MPRSQIHSFFLQAFCDFLETSYEGLKVPPLEDLPPQVQHCAANERGERGYFTILFQEKDLHICIDND